MRACYMPVTCMWNVPKAWMLHAPRYIFSTHTVHRTLMLHACSLTHVIVCSVHVTCIVTCTLFRIGTPTRRIFTPYILLVGVVSYTYSGGCKLDSNDCTAHLSTFVHHRLLLHVHVRSEMVNFPLPKQYSQFTQTSEFSERWAMKH